MGQFDCCLPSVDIPIRVKFYDPVARTAVVAADVSIRGGTLSRYDVATVSGLNDTAGNIVTAATQVRFPLKIASAGELYDPKVFARSQLVCSTSRK